jgi:HEXXH motif-containing protein
VSGAGRQWVILPPELLGGWEFDGIRADLDPQDPGPLHGACPAAAGVIAGTEYLAWVETVVRFLVPWRAAPGELPSGSSSGACIPGVIGIGNHEQPLALADTLVHEASHQYCYIITKLGPLDDGSDQSLYYNPFLEVKRPISRIVLAYHAFANILLFWRTAVAHGLSSCTYVSNRNDVLLAGLPLLEGALLKTKALTPFADALWKPLYEQLHGRVCASQSN